jgi:imidazolonepropionase-like amidohydrolase
VPDRDEYPAPDERAAAKLSAAGATVAIASFARSFGSLASGSTGRWLLQDASVAGGYGLSDEEILRAVTITPARILCVADRVGSIEPGKDADLIVLDGSPFATRTWVERVFVGGEQVFERSR